MSSEKPSPDGLAQASMGAPFWRGEAADQQPSRPCVGCGWCCLRDPCAVSHRLYGHVRRCPDLSWDEAAGRYVCLLMLDDERGAEVQWELAAGEGCCAPLNEWRAEVKERG